MADRTDPDLGEWATSLYPSGTRIVWQNVQWQAPWLYIYGPRIPDEGQREIARRDVCEQIAEYLNGRAERPAWLDDLRRISADTLMGEDGTSIRATGPMYDADPPNCNWKEREDDGARGMRRGTIDFLAGKEWTDG